jgi:hypothetical protein
MCGIIWGYIVYALTGWYTTKVTPPNELVEVMDEEGCILRVYPTYYNFRLKEAQIIDCKPYWDGGWMVYRNGEVKKPSRDIYRWRRIKQC